MVEGQNVKVNLEARVGLLESIVGNIRDAVLVTEIGPIDEPGPRIAYVNESFSRMTGYGMADIVGKTPRILQGPETDRAPLDEIRAALSLHEPVRVELLNYRKDSTEFWVEVDITPIADGRGNHTHWVSVQREVTDRRKQEEALRESEERLRTILVQYATDMITILEPNGDIRYQSPAVERVLGYKPEELIGENIVNYVHPEDVDRVLAKLGMIREKSGIRGPIESRFRHRNGSWRCLEGIGNNLIKDPAVGGVVVNSRDVTERKDAEQELREAEERYRNLVENVPSIIYIQKPVPGKRDSYEVSYMSPRIEDILGYPTQRFVEDQNFWNELVHPDDLAEVVAKDGRTDASGDLSSLEYRMSCEDGRVVWIRDEARLIRGPEGEPLYRQGIMTDVTARRKSQDALRESEERYRSVADNVKEVVFETDAEGNFTFLTPAWEDITGFTVEEGVGKSYLEFVHPDDLERNLEDLEEMGGHGGEYTEYEARFQAKDGSPRDIEIKFREHFEDDDLVSTSGTLNDITERKKTENELLESEQRFRLLFEQSVDAMYVHDLEGRFVDCNSQACALLGYSREELLSMSVADISRNVLTGEERARKEEEGGTLWQCVTEGEPGVFSQGHEEENVRKDGTVFPVEVRVGSVDYGGRRMVLASARDVTERKEAEEALVRQKQYLDALNETALGLMDRLESEDLLENMLGRAGALLGTDHGFFSLLTQEEDALELRAGTGFFADLVGDRIETSVGLAGKVFQTGEPFAVDNYSSWPGKRTDVGDPPYAMLGVPLHSGSRVIGVISLAYMREERTFGAEETEVLNRFAKLASVALDNANLYSVAQREIAEREQAEEEQRRRARELALLHEVRSSLSLELDPVGVCRTAVEAVAESYGYVLVSTYLVDNEELIMQHQVGFDNYRKTLDRIPAGPGVMWRVVRNREPELLEDVWADSDFIAAIQGIVSEICVPLIDEEQVIGVLNVESTEGTPLDEKDLRLLKGVGEHVGVALERARLYARAKEAEEHFRGAFENASTGMALVSLDGQPYRANHALRKMFGYSEAEIMEKGSSGLTHPEDLEKTRERDERMVAEDGPDKMSLEKRYLHKNGSVLWVISDVSVVRDASGEPSHFVCQFQDITARKRAEGALVESETRYRAVVEQTEDGIFFGDFETLRVLEANVALGRMLGYTVEELRGMRLDNFIVGDPEAIQHNNRLIRERGNHFIGERRYRRKDGTLIDVETSVTTIPYGGEDSSCCVARDITARKRAEEALLESEERFRGAFENASTGVSLVGLDNRHFRVNRALCRMLGYSEEELVGMRTFDITHPDDRTRSRSRTERLLEGNGPGTMSLEKRYAKKDGSVVWMISDVSLVRDVDGEPSHFVAHYQDITRRKSLEQQLSYQALHDPLTDLPNRNSLYRRFERITGHLTALSQARRDGSPGGLPGDSPGDRRCLAVLFLDLDGFKEINDSLGHAAGDDLLKAVAGRLQGTIRPQDTVARLGGDEFCILLAGISGAAEAARIAERLRMSLDASFSITQSQDSGADSGPGPASIVSVNTSIGIAVSGLNEMERSLDEFLREADAAMYRAKKRGGALYEIVELTEDTDPET